MKEDTKYMYSDAVEYYDIAAYDMWKEKKMLYYKIFSLFQKENGPVLDIGAGTGLFSMELAKYTEDLDIIALEPSKEMRIAFMAKLMQQGTLSSRITVVPESVMEYELPDTLSGVVCMGVIGHLNQGQREKLWRRLEKSLKKGTPVIIETLDKSLLKAEEGTRISAKAVGKYRYETYIKDKKNAGGDLWKWNLQYKVLEDDKLVREVISPMEWEYHTVEELQKEISTYSFRCGKLSDTILIARKKQEEN